MCDGMICGFGEKAEVCESGIPPGLSTRLVDVWRVWSLGLGLGGRLG